MSGQRFPGLSPTLSRDAAGWLPWWEGKRTTRGQAWVACHGGFSFFLQPRKQREWEVSQGPVGAASRTAVGRGQEGARQTLPASRCRVVFCEQEPASPCYSNYVPRGSPHASSP